MQQINVHDWPNQFETLNLLNIIISQIVQTSHLTIIHTALNTHVYAISSLIFPGHAIWTEEIRQ